MNSETAASVLVQLLTQPAGQTILVVAASGSQATHLRRLLRGCPAVVVAPYYSLHGFRGHVVVVLPQPATATPAQVAEYESALKNQIPTRVAPGGTLVRL